MKSYQLVSCIDQLKSNGGRLDRVTIRESRSTQYIVLEAVKMNGMSLEYASGWLKDDKEIVLEAVRQNGRALGFASERLRDDLEVVLEAVKKDGSNFQLSSERIRSDREAVIAATKVSGDAFLYRSRDLVVDDELIEAVIDDYGMALNYGSDKLKSDKQMVIRAVKADKRAFWYASKELRADDDVATLASGSCWVIEDIIRDGIEDSDANRALLAQIAKEKNAKYMVHFTSINNLNSIMNNGLLTRRELDQNSRFIPGRNYFITDHGRIDKMTDTISLSFTRPNWKMLLSKMCGFETNTYGWAIIRLKADSILRNHRCLFFHSNAANKIFESDRLSKYDRYTKYDLLSMFWNQSEPDGRTSDPQAEIMCCDSIPVSEIDNVVFANYEDAALYRDKLTSLGIETVVDKSFFVMGGRDYDGE